MGQKILPNNCSSGFSSELHVCSKRHTVDEYAGEGFDCTDAHNIGGLVCVSQPRVRNTPSPPCPHFNGPREWRCKVALQD